MSRTRRSGLTFVSGTLLNIATMMIGLWAAPLLLRWLGPERLGLFQGASSWLGQLAVLEVGLGGASLPMLAAALAGGPLSLRSVLSAVFSGYRLLLAVCSILVVALVFAIPHLLQIPAGLERDVRLGMVISALGLLALPLTPLRALIEAAQHGYLIVTALAVQSLLITGLSLSLAYLKWGVTGQFIAAFLGAVVFWAVVFWQARRYVGGTRALVSLLFTRADPSARSELKGLHGHALIVLLGGRIGLLTDNLLIGYFFPARFLPAFIYTQKLSSIAQWQVQSAGNATWAGISELYLSGRTHVFQQRFVEVTRLVVILAIAGTLPIALYNRTFIALWVGVAQYGGGLLTVLACINAVALGVVSFWAWIFTGTGKIARLTPIIVTGTIVNVAVSIAATRYGLFCGPVLGSTIALAGIQLLWIPLEIRREFGVSVRELVAAVGRPLLVAGICAPLFWFIAHAHPPAGWFSLAFQTGTAFFLLIAAQWYGALNVAERSVWKLRIRMLSRRAEPIDPGRPKADMK